MLRGKSTVVGICARLLSLVFGFIVLMSAHAAEVTTIDIKSSIGPAVADFFVRSIHDARDDDFILVHLDTPGGLEQSMRAMVSAILTSPIPVVVYVSPSGARAASAGTYLLYASTIAAMAPGTHVGAASPISLISSASDTKESDGTQSTSYKKITNDAVAYIRGLAQLRQRNPDFAKQSVLDAKTVTASEALKLKVINVVAQDDHELFQKINGMKVIQNGRELYLNANDVHVKPSVPDWRMKLLWIITDPTIAYLMLILGVYGIFFELMNPGFFAPGVIGAVAICLALYALHLLPVNYAGLTLILLGISFILAEIWTPSFGVLGIGGTVAFIFGSILLIDPIYESYRISRAAISAMVVFNVIIFLIGLRMALQGRKRAVKHGLKPLLGQVGKTISPVSLQGQALIQGEIWSVYSKKPIPSDRQVIVKAVHGLHLEIEEQLKQGE